MAISVAHGAWVTPGTTQVFGLLIDEGGNLLLARGVTVPSDGEKGYAKGCLFIDLDVATGTSGLYVNVGVVGSANFDLVTDA